MSFDFSKFDNEFAGIVDEVKNVEEFDDVEVPHGTYEVSIQKMQLVETKKAPARPMLTIWFKVLEGEYKGQMIFMNQVLTHPFAIAISRDFIKSLEPNTLSDDEIAFEGYASFAELIQTAFEGIENQKEYALEYGENKGGYDTFEILDVFEI